ncbi:thioredoxin fold domain-containing protein [Campylobacter sp. MG1]|uniref:thioredoxin fold domain-containing protein n=1 Tax=Campylobacter sp. MG1 TaxID=2976332 RepID=UPI00226CD3DE|nr:thioredoxin fold domain-containing protein [Campylobacter sp. MG1]
MKKLIITLCCLGFLNAGIYTNIDTAFEKAEKNNKLLVLFAVTDTCRHCHTFLNNLKNTQTLDILGKEYEVAILEIKDNLELFANYFTLSVTPTTFVINPKRPDLFIPEIKGAVEPNKVLEYVDKVREVLNPK